MAQTIRSSDDLNLSASDGSGGESGDLVFITNNVERARIKYDGTGTGWANVIGGSSAVWLRPSQKLPVRPTHTMLTTFAAGHGWTVSGTGVVSNVNDTTDGNYLFGSQGVTITTDGLAHSATFKNFSLTSTDFSASSTVVWVKVDDISTLATLELWWGDTSLANSFYCLLLDGSLTVGPPIRSGEWFPIRIPRDRIVQTGTPNWAAITNMQLKVTDKGAGAVTVHFGGIARIPDPTPFPNGVVSITFDDGYITQFTEGRKKLDQYGYPATAYIIRDLIGSGANFMTLANLTELQDKHGWEIAAHAYTQADHDANFTTLTSAQVDTDAWQMKKWLIDNGFRGHNHFAYPGGIWNLTTDATLATYFSTVRLLENTPRQALPPVTHPTARLQSLQVLNTTAASPNGTVGTVEWYIDNAYNGKSWLILVFHKLVSSPSVSTEYSITNFATIIDYINSKGIPVKTIGDVLASL